jgi:hypothetical protein
MLSILLKPHHQQLTLNLLLDRHPSILRLHDDVCEEGVDMIQQHSHVLLSDFRLEELLPEARELVDLLFGYVCDALLDLYSGNTPINRRFNATNAAKLTSNFPFCLHSICHETTMRIAKPSLFTDC